MFYPIKKKTQFICLIFVISSFIQAQSFEDFSGRITDENNRPIVGANIYIREFEIGTTSDNDGDFNFVKLNRKMFTLEVSFIGFEKYSETIFLEEKDYSDFTVVLKKIDLELDPIYVTGTRTERNRSENPSIIGVIDHRKFTQTNSLNLSEGLNYLPSVRVEIDCQTCNFSQVRLNGLGGAYSQILINSRPIFSSLNSLYGLDQIPTNMVDRIEILRGGGSAIFGSSSVGGTINVITREPLISGYELKLNNSSIDGSAGEQSLQINSSFVNGNRSSGISFFGLLKKRDEYDANGDGFSEIPLINSNSFGLNSFLKLSDFSKLTIDAHMIYEKRRGGNKNGLPPHQTDQSEDRVHNIFGGGITFEKSILSLNAVLSLYVSGQFTDRLHYTGIDGADAYGTTDAYTLVSGAQITKEISNPFVGKSLTLTAGVESIVDDVLDEIPGYNYLIDQHTQQYGLFIQNELLFGDFNFLFGARVDKHSALDDLVVSPRLNFLVFIKPELQLRASFSTGFRAPQAFDADMHIAFSGGGISYIRIDENLIKESSVSYSFSLDYNDAMNNLIWGWTLESFYTNLKNTFILEDFGADPEDPQNTILMRKNGGNATVLGLSANARMNFNNQVDLDLGLTWQRSLFENKVYWSNELDGTKEFLKSPNIYGFYSLDYKFYDYYTISLSGLFTGAMYVPHVAGAPGNLADELVITKPFLEQGLKISYKLKAFELFENLNVFLGVKNIFNQYQNDFDIGKNRDSNYIYGPAAPRTIYMGFSVNGD
ncbi:MAG: TonB-dependent receptor [Melioribacteraceae bacterium]|nr:TonB-dependent receptor [Melioribacteraceae bacterium]